MSLTSILRFAMLLSLVVWVGGIVFFAFVLAPALFSILPSRELAGAVVSRTLGALHWMGIVAALVFLIAAWIERRVTHAANTVKMALVAAMLLLTMLSQFGVTRRMAG